MSRPVYLNKAEMEAVFADMKEKLLSSKLTNGVFEYTSTFEHKDPKLAIVRFSPMAYLKTMLLLYNNTGEVAWHGTCRRVGEDTGSEFEVDDILVYPQEVTGATVTTDQDGYQQWLMKLDDDTANNLRFQAHSHVNMGVSPSSVDENQQSLIVSQLRKDEDFYVFMIINKKLDMFFRIYDLKNNILYDTKDVYVEVGEGFDPGAFLDAADSMVTQHSWNVSAGKVSYGYGYGMNPPAAAKGGKKSKKASAPSQPASSGAKSAGVPRLDRVDDYDDYIFGSRRSRPAYDEMYDEKEV